MIWFQRSFSIATFSVILLLTTVVPAVKGQIDLVVPGDHWRYWDLGSEPDGWSESAFDDSDWASGPSPLGFGELFIATPLDTSIRAGYFRLSFQLPAIPIGPMKLRVLRDDGVVVYLNGAEVMRNNMPAGDPTYTTPANQPLEAFDYLETSVAPSFFMAGNNVLAAEVHQVAGLSSDIVFDLQLQDTNDPTGPHVFITSPANNATLPPGTDLTIRASAGPEEDIFFVDFYEGENYLGGDDLPPYETVWPFVPEGIYFLRAVAWFTDGSSLTSAPVRINVMETGNQPPSGFITSPANNATLPPGNVTLRAFGSDPDGTITLVEFFANGNKVGETSQTPYEVNWTNVVVGDYSIFARFTDNEQATGDSPGIFLRVRESLGVIRGPYLQMGTPTSVIVKWRTDVAFDSIVRYGLTPGNLDQSVHVDTVTTEHEVPLTGLSPDTKYYYSIGSSAVTQGSGPDYFFITSPPGPKPTRIWVIGDSGTGTEGARQVWQSYLNYTGTRYTDLWLMLGDNAYGGGSDFEYQRGMFDMYPDTLRQTVVWPTIGNHDASPDYFSIFSLPRNGEAGGVPSGVENYYSFDYGNIHFICLGGYYSGSLSSNGTMCTWLKADLDANTNKWLIAFWHQPPYTKGSHNSDVEGDLIAMRENAVPILESYGVDLVLCGHSHNYERSFLMRGHYGHSSTFDKPTMAMDGGSGRIDDTGAYVKQTDGTVYIVAGSSGWITGSHGLNHPAMYVSWLRMGSLVLDIDGDALQGTFLNESGGIDDYFTMLKDSTIVRIVNLTLDEGTATITWTAQQGRRYQLEFTPDLTAEWTPVGNEVHANGPVADAVHVTNEAPRGFYRVRLVR